MRFPAAPLVRRTALLIGCAFALILAATSSAGAAIVPGFSCPAYRMHSGTKKVTVSNIVSDWTDCISTHVLITEITGKGLQPAQVVDPVIGVITCTYAVNDSSTTPTCTWPGGGMLSYSSSPDVAQSSSSPSSKPKAKAKSKKQTTHCEDTTGTLSYEGKSAQYYVTKVRSYAVACSKSYKEIDAITYKAFGTVAQDIGGKDSAVLTYNNLKCLLQIDTKTGWSGTCVSRFTKHRALSWHLDFDPS